MTDTQWADVSSNQVVVTDAYPWPLFAFRSNDGNIEDQNFAKNYAWAAQAADSGQIFCFIVYCFYRPSGDSLSTLMSMVGPNPHPRMVIMFDVENDNGSVTGDQSAQLNAELATAAAYLGGNADRVIGYGNVNDLDDLWPNRPASLRFVIPAYGSNPSFPGKFAHQFADNFVTAPFGACDINSADGMTVTDLEAMFGFADPPSPPDPPNILDVTNMQQATLAVTVTLSGIGNGWVNVPVDISTLASVTVEGPWENAATNPGNVAVGASSSPGVMCVSVFGGPPNGTVGVLVKSWVPA